MCFGGSPKITSPPPPPPPPQLAKVPDAALIRKKVDDMAIGQGGMPSTTLLTGPQGDPLAVNQLNKKTLLGG